MESTKVHNQYQLRGLDENENEKEWSGSGTQKGLQVIGVILLFLLIMTLLRYLLNCLIDVVVLKDFRYIAQLRRRLCCCCCCWRQPPTHSPSHLTSRPVESDMGSEVVDMDRLLEGLTPNEKQELLTTLFKTQIATAENLHPCKRGEKQFLENNMTSSFSSGEESGGSVSHCDSHDQHDNNTSNSNLPTNEEDDGGKEYLCPICIHPIETGQLIISSSCSHQFHSQCLIQWLSTSHARDCPYCRTEILTLDMLEQAFRQRRHI